MADESPARITRVKLKNYKSIVSCDVELRPLTILVGPNGSGKSSFLDALRFVSEALTVGLDQAIRNRGNVGRILSRGRRPDESSFGVALDFRLSAGGTGSYSFEVEALPDGDYRITRERLERFDLELPGGPDLFSIDRAGATMFATSEVADKYPIASDRLFLVRYADMPEARPVSDLLTSMAFYNLDPASMRVLTPSEPGRRLLDDGRNVASILRQIQAAAPETMQRITSHLARVLPGLERIDVEDLRGYDVLTFQQQGPERRDEWDFSAAQMSDGTLRALAILVALFQSRIGGKSDVSLVGIEEPEAGLHPAAADVLFNALVDASATSQVLVTTHSADLLQNSDLDVDQLLAVEAEGGVTKIGPIDDVGRSILRDRLATVGELLQTKLLHPRVHDNGANGGIPVSKPAVAG